jgi:hypothetical protein
MRKERFCVIRYRAFERRVRLRRVGRLGFRLLTVAFVAWGSFSAAAVFAIRYDLWPLAGPEPNRADESIALRAAPLLDAANWRHVLSPDASLAAVLSAPELRGFRGDDSTASHIEARAALIWQSDANRALWRLLLQRPGCPCPADRVARWDIARVILDPLTGAVLFAHVETGLSPDALRTEQMSYAMHPVTQAGES